ncbi:MAG: hypothetical protein ABI574_16655 [Burkholderiales bacterium]
MKTYQIEIQRLKSLTQSKGLFELRLDALVLPAPRARDDDESPSTVLSLSEQDARSLLLLLKKQFADMEQKNKGRSQR